LDRQRFLQITTDIEALRSAWAETHGRRQRGAVNALAGYRYQFLVVLLQTIERLLSNPESERGEPRVFHECLADALEVTEDGLICVTEIKLRHSSSLLGRALEELWSVYEVAAERLPHVLERLSFRVLAAESDLADVGAAVDRWCTAKGADASRFRERLTIHHESHPEDRLFALLANRLRADSPLDLIHRWIDQLLGAVGGGEGALRQAELSILDDLVALHNQGETEGDAIYVWEERDRPPTAVSPGGFLAGRQPRIGDLRDGYFARLPELYEHFRLSVLSWISRVSSGQADRYKLPLFWLQGRSGTGKSVALLHLLAGLHEDGHGPIFWLGQRISLLPQAMRFAVKAAIAGKTPIIGIDDPYTPTAQDNARRDWDLAFAELQQYRDAAEESTAPVLVVCCAPTEQAAQFSADFADEVDLCREGMPHERPPEITVLRQWYRERTGQEPPELGDENLLMVQLFFEWKKGEPLREFAGRFRKRVLGTAGSDRLFQALSRVFALNRLYVGYPSDAVASELGARDAGLLAQLRSDEHFGVDPAGERSGFWWLHPHLSNGIYEAWYPPEPFHAPARREHLLQGIRDCLAFGQRPNERAALLWAIARALKAGPADDLGRRLERSEILDVLAGSYRGIAQRQGEALPLQLIPVWIELGFALPELTLNPDPSQQAIREVRAERIDEPGLRLTCHKLLQYLPQMPPEQGRTAREAVLQLLEACPRWYEWLPIAWDAARRTRDPRLWPLIAAWIDAHSTHPAAARLLHSCLNLASGSDHLTATAMKLLPETAPDFAWGDIAKELFKRYEPDCQEVVLQWAEAHHRHLSLCFLLETLLRRRVLPARTWARAWLRLWHPEASANYVLEPLVELEGLDEELLGWSLAWLDLESGDSSFLMQRLVEAAPGDERVVNRAWAWLAANAHTKSWSFVWEALRRARRIGPGDLQRLEAARELLARSSPSHPFWGIVWESLWRAWPEDRDLLESGRRWLSEAGPDLDSWGHVWLGLRKSFPQDQELLSIAMSWLRRADPHSSWWGIIWDNLWKVWPEDEVLLETGRKWLQEVDPDHESWSYVWPALRKSLPEDEELLSIARQWLGKAHSNHGGWGLVWDALWKVWPEDRDFLETGRRWLSEVDPNHGSWSYLWSDLRKSLPQDESLLPMGRTWLARVDPNHAAWTIIWDALQKALPDDRDLLDQAQQWLARVDPNCDSWTRVWTHMREARPADDEIVAIALRWIERASWGNEGWGFVWDSLWKLRPHDESILRLGRQWLVGVEPRHESWGYVWTDLRKSFPKDAELLSLASAWLDRADLKHGSWGVIFDALWKAHPGDENLLDRGRSWLLEAPAEHSSWGFVWQDLWQQDPILVEKGRQWLKDVGPNHEGWWYVWKDLWQELPRDEELQECARQWLGSVEPNHGSWWYVWNDLRQSAPLDEGLLEGARRWLTQVSPAHGSWAFVWKDAYGACPEDAQLLDVASRWLTRVNKNHGGWGVVWSILWTARKGCQELWEHGRLWLGAVSNNHTGWGFVWNELWEERPGDATLTELGRRWIDIVDSRHGGWTYVWRGLWKGSPGDPELYERALRWMDAINPREKSWSFVWQALWERLPCDAGLWARGLRCLDEAGPRHGSWTFVWSDLWRLAPGDPALVDRARRWLSEVKPEHSRWPHVWVALYRAHPREPGLLDQGHQWLDQIPEKQPGRKRVEKACGSPGFEDDIFAL
jgi:hypothetical protein